MSPEELQRLFAESPMAMKARYDALSRQPGSPAMREAFLRRQGVPPSSGMVNNHEYERGTLDRIQRARAEQLLADPMIGKGEAKPEPMGEPQIRQRELAGGPSPEFLRAAGVAPEPREAMPAPVSNEGEATQPSWFSQRRNNFDNSISGIAAAFANNPNPSWGQIGAAMAGGAAQGKERQSEQRYREAQIQSAMQSGELQRIELEEKINQRKALDAAMADLPPEMRRKLQLAPDKAGDILFPEAKYEKVGNKLVRIGGGAVGGMGGGAGGLGEAGGGEVGGGPQVVFDAGPEPLTPYQEQELALRRAEMERRGQASPADLARLELERERFDWERQSGKGLPDKYETLAPEEVAAANLPKGTFAQRNLTTNKIEYKDPTGRKLVPVQTKDGPRLVPEDQAENMVPADTRENPGFRNAKDLRDSYEQLTKDARNAVVAYDKLDSSLKQGTGAGDIAGIFNFMKALDPTSTVAAGEQASAANASGIPDRIRVYYNQAIKGEKLSPTQRKEMLDVARGQTGAYRKSYDEVATNYRDLAKRSDVKPEDVVLPLRFPEMPVAPPPPPPPPGGGGIVNPANAAAPAPADLDLDALIDDELRGFK